jgi:5'-nucleotidase
MKTNRRNFLRILGAGSLWLSASNSLKAIGSAVKKDRLVILHTNDVHSHLEPFPSNDPKFPGLGGVEQRAALIRKIRSEDDHVLLLDAGDIFQGTPYFNLYQGEVELKLMSQMGYDVTAIGNHDFDAGMDNLAKQLQHATFPMICANYDFTGTPLEGKIQPYIITHRAGMKIGIFGLGIELDGLVDRRLYGKTVYKDPLLTASQMVIELRDKKKCDLVICLSHLGYKYESDKVSDVVLAKKSRGIDIIIGGHTHTLLEKPFKYKNRDGKDVVVAQVGWAGIHLGKIIVETDHRSKETKISFTSIPIKSDVHKA